MKYFLAAAIVPIVVSIIIGITSSKFLGDDNPIEEKEEEKVKQIVKQFFGIDLDIDFTFKTPEEK